MGTTRAASLFTGSFCDCIAHLLPVGDGGCFTYLAGIETVNYESLQIRFTNHVLSGGGKDDPVVCDSRGASLRRGMYVGFFVAPTDFQQGDAYRIIFIHVPAAWMGMFLYVLMAIYAGIGWAFNARLASMMASAIAITGAMFTLVSLVTGACGENRRGARTGFGTRA